MSVLRLAIPSPLRRLFDYLPPEDMPASDVASLQPGQRFSVPFGSRTLTGYLTGVFDESATPASTLRPAHALLDSQSLIDRDLIALAQWAAQYYHHPPGEVFAALFPKRLRDGKEHRALGLPSWRLTSAGLGLPETPLRRAKRQAEAVTLLRSGPMSASALKEQGISSAIMRALSERGLAEPCSVTAATRKARAVPGLPLNSQQGAALQALLSQSEGFSCHLLEGVTGSGKTEVYLQLIADCLSRGKQALVLIPEIGLTPQTLARFSERFDAEIAVLHSGLGEAQRQRAWEAARDGSAHIIIGTRSAVFTPMARPGLLVIDEEHDSSFKQQDGFRYNARDVAVKRAQLLHCPVVLGSATPSLESIYNAQRGRYAHHRLTQRAAGASLPTIEVFDLKRQPLQGGLSEPLLEAVEQTLARGQQALLFLNRRGYAPTLQCHDCGWVAGCNACDARLTIHRRQRRLRCHHCGAAKPLAPACPECNSEHLITSGLGTEQAEEVLRQRFTSYPVYRVDSDSMQGRESMASLVEQINRGEPCILLGTQMLTKGHHFPGVTLVAVIDADALLFSADFRGTERMAQLLTQVAGRAGRSQNPGRVIVQSHYRDHPALQAMMHSDYSTQARDILQQRHDCQMPPCGQLVVLRTDCTDGNVGERFLQDLRNQTERALPVGSALIGPLPAPMQRRAGMFRSQLMLHCEDRARAQAGASLLVAQADAMKATRGLKWTIDIDPQDLF